MTRPKVPADKRIRTAQCNGLHPCNTCKRRDLMCSYASGHHVLEQGSSSESVLGSSKRRHVELNPGSKEDSSEQPGPYRADHLVRSDQWSTAQKKRSRSQRPGWPPSEASSKSLDLPESGSGSHSRNSTASAPDEESPMWVSTRMLQDPTGRLLYVGDSASLAYLQLIRMIVETRTGENSFTWDPDRHKIMEASIPCISSGIALPHSLPDRATAAALIDSFFVNTSGLLETVNRSVFQTSVDGYYAGTFVPPPSFRCLLYLVLAIGTLFGTPVQGSQAYVVFRELRRSQENPAEVFFRSAKSLGDPVSGFEDADLWSVQALSLMTVYMLAVSKRNAAYAYFGMAVRSAFALGLHRVQENHSIFQSEDVTLRRNLWRSLFVLDRFLAASLGRPAAIVEDECASDALDVYTKSESGELVRMAVEGNALDAAVKSCQIIGQILKRIYARRRISVRLAQDLARQCNAWSEQLHHAFRSHEAHAKPVDPAQGIAALHVNLLHCHSVILLTRPFFICMLSKVHNERNGHRLPVPRWINKTTQYCEACFLASKHTILLVQQAYEGGYLPQRNPFVLYFFFAACLIILSNEFGAIYSNPSYEHFIGQSTVVMKYCSMVDPQAERLLVILSSFRETVAKAKEHQVDKPAFAQPEIKFQGTAVTGLFFPAAGSRKSSFTTSTSTFARPRQYHSGNPPSVVPAFAASPPLSMKQDSTGALVTSGPAVSGVSPASSTAHSSGGPPDTTDSLGPDGELDFDRLLGPWTAPTHYESTGYSFVEAPQVVPIPQPSMSGLRPSELRITTDPSRLAGFHAVPQSSSLFTLGQFPRMMDRQANGS